MIKQLLQVVVCIFMGFLAVLVGPHLLIAIAYITMYAFAIASVLFVVGIVGSIIYKMYKQASDKLK